MPDLFGRPIPPHYSGIDANLDGLENDRNVDHRAVGKNLRIDDRVSDSRAVRFLRRWRFLRRRRSGALLTALQKSHKTAAREFWNYHLNANNIVFSPRLGLKNRNLNGSTRLVTIQFLRDTIRSQLGALLRTRRIAEEGDDDLGDSRSASSTPGGDIFVDDWLDRHAEGKEPADKAELPDLLATAIEKAYPLSAAFPYDRVVWVGLADEFEPHANLGARRWLEVFGLGHFLFDPRLPNQWFVALSYRLADVPVAARPCVLEAGANPWHFPTRASWPAVQGGRTVILGEARMAGVHPMTEFVHLNRRIHAADVVAVSRYVPQGFASREEELKTARDAHRSG